MHKKIIEAHTSAGFSATDTIWRSMYGLSSKVITLLWCFLVSLPTTEKMEIQPVHLLWASYFMKVYTTTSVAQCMWHVDAKIWRKYIWRVILSLYLYMDLVGHFSVCFFNIIKFDRYNKSVVLLGHF